MKVERGRRIRRAVCGRCCFPMDLWGGIKGKGKFLSCPECRAEYRSGANFIFGTIIHTVFWKESIEADPSTRAGALWQVDTARGKRKILFLTCPNCASVCQADLSDVDDEGYVGGTGGYTCVTCEYCHHHFWPYLKGWEGS